MGILDKIFGRKESKDKKKSEAEVKRTNNVEDAPLSRFSIYREFWDNPPDRLSLADLNFSIDIPADFGFRGVYKSPRDFRIDYFGDDGVYYETYIQALGIIMTTLDISCHVQKKRLTDRELLKKMNAYRSNLKYYEKEGSEKTIKSEYILFSGHPTHHCVYKNIARNEIHYHWTVATRDIVYSIYYKTPKDADSVYSEEDKKEYYHNVESVKKMIKTVRIDGESMDISEEELNEAMKIINKEEDEKATTAEFDEFQFPCPLCGHEFMNIKFDKIAALGSRTLVCEGCENKVHAVKHSNGKLTVSMETLPIGETAETHEYDPIEKKGN